jgi:predicted acyltransferase (DUF342 family)
VDYEGQGNVLFGMSSVTLSNNSSAAASLDVLSPGSVTIANNAEVRGVIWGGLVTLDNNAEVIGKIYGQQFGGNQINNNFTFIQDPAVTNTPPPPGIDGTVQVLSWQENPGVW